MNISSAQMFYVLQQPFSDEKHFIYGKPAWDHGYGRASWTDEVKMESIRCPVEPGHQRAGKRLGDLNIVLPSEKIGDFTWTWSSECLLSERVLLLFREAGFTGFTVKPVKVEKRTEKGNEMDVLPVLWELAVTGQGGNADPQSGIRLIYTCPHCGLDEYSSFRNGIIVDERNWDGSDFFTVTGYPKHILVTERVKNLIIKYKLTNCMLIPSQKLVWSIPFRPEDIYGSDE